MESCASPSFRPGPACVPPRNRTRNLFPPSDVKIADAELLVRLDKHEKNVELAQRLGVAPKTREEAVEAVVEEEVAECGFLSWTPLWCCSMMWCVRVVLRCVPPCCSMM